MSQPTAPLSGPLDAGTFSCGGLVMKDAPSRTSSAASRRHAGRSAGSKIKKGSGTKTRYKKIEREIEEKALQINSLEARVCGTNDSF